MRIDRKEFDYGEHNYGYTNMKELCKSRYGTLNISISEAKALYDEIFTDFAFPGGYPVLFMDDAGNTYCADCAKKVFILENTDITSDIYYEGDTIYCDNCNKEIESAYGSID